MDEHDQTSGWLLAAFLWLRERTKGIIEEFQEARQRQTQWDKEYALRREIERKAVAERKAQGEIGAMEHKEGSVSQTPTIDDIAKGLEPGQRPSPEIERALELLRSQRARDEERSGRRDDKIVIHLPDQSNRPLEQARQPEQAIEGERNTNTARQQRLDRLEAARQLVDKEQREAERSNNHGRGRGRSLGRER